MYSIQNNLGGSAYSFGGAQHFSAYFLILFGRTNNTSNINITTTILVPSTEPIVTPMIKLASSVETNHYCKYISMVNITFKLNRILNNTF